MYEDLITQLDSLGVTYEEDEEGGLTINISDIDKDTLVEIISALNNLGETFDIDADTITLSGVSSADTYAEGTEDTGESTESTDYLDEALGQYGG